MSSSLPLVFNSLRIGKESIPIDIIRSIEYIDYTRVRIEFETGAEVTLVKDNYTFTEWDAFIRHLKMVFIV